MQYLISRLNSQDFRKQFIYLFIYFYKRQTTELVTYLKVMVATPPRSPPYHGSLVVTYTPFSFLFSHIFTWFVSIQTIVLS